MTGVLLALLWLQALTPIIDSNNVENLGSVAELDFSEVESLGLTPGSGVFVMSAGGSRIISFANADGESPLSTAVVWEDGEIADTQFIGDNSLARALSADGTLLAVATLEGVSLVDLENGEQQMVIQVENGPVLGVWINSEGVVCGETSPTLDSPAEIVCDDGREAVPLFDDDAADFVRIGRVPAPLAVLGSETGTMTRWNLETGEITAQAEAGDVAIFGSVNIDGAPDAPGSGSHLAWRDPYSTQLNLLDFASGENQAITPLDGSFIAHLLLARGADVILAIDPMSARRSVWAWRLDGEKIDLGQFRECTRQQPDLAAFSADGSTLVIGCDTGLDVWRVQEN
jgi:hypothetical protein